MKLAATIASEMSGPGHRLDASYHASDGIRALRFLQEWSGTTLQNGQSSEGILKEQAIPYGENYLDFWEMSVSQMEFSSLEGSSVTMLTIQIMVNFGYHLRTCKDQN